MTEDDIPYHIPTAFKEGDYVVVVGVVRQAHAWHGSWTQSAQRLVGKRVKVASISPAEGFYCSARGMGHEMLRAFFPSPALRNPANDGPVVIEVPSV